MSGLEIEGHLSAGTVNIRTLNRVWAADGSGKLMLTKTSQVTFSGVAADVQHPLKIAFLVKSSQDVDRFRITSDPSLVPVPDRPDGQRCGRRFWLGFGGQVDRLEDPVRRPLVHDSRDGDKASKV